MPTPEPEPRDNLGVSIRYALCPSSLHLPQPSQTPQQPPQRAQRHLPSRSSLIIQPFKLYQNHGTIFAEAATNSEPCAFRATEILQKLLSATWRTILRRRRGREEKRGDVYSWRQSPGFMAFSECKYHPIWWMRHQDIAQVGRVERVWG